MSSSLRQVEALAAEIRARLAERVCPEFRDGQRRVFRHEVDTWGERMPDVRAIAAAAYGRIKAWPKGDRNRLCTELWSSGKLEEAVMVPHIYRRFARECAACEFRLFERWLDRYVNNWASCDGLASWLFAACIENEPVLISELRGWTGSANRWRRRAAAVSLLQEAKAGRHTKEILDVAGRLAPDRDDMVEKGAGWLLKETYPRRPAETLAFLTAAGDRFSRTTLRYAAEKMPREVRQRLLKDTVR